MHNTFDIGSLHKIIIIYSNHPTNINFVGECEPKEPSSCIPVFVYSIVSNFGFGETAYTWY